MKLQHLILVAVLTLGVAGSAAAQTAGGRVVRMANFSIADMALFSQQDYTMGTARSAALGGAFVSLGADMSSMALNPAGLGMYRSSEFSFSPSLTWTKSTDKLLGGGSYVTLPADQKKTQFSMGNIGLALNLYQSTGPLTSFTLGFGYTKLADFNYSSAVGANGRSSSIVDAYAEQLNDMGFSPGELAGMDWDDFYPEEWGAVAALDTKAAFQGDDTWYHPNLESSATINNLLIDHTRGSLGEFDLSAGMNFSNRLYLGFTMGIQSLNYEQTSYYEELYDQPAAPAGEMPYLDFMSLDQRLRYTGVGVNFKLGLILRPVDELRLGLAVHTPTIMTLDREYRIRDFYAEDQNGDWTATSSNYLSWRYAYTSPTRIMAGASYMLGGVSLLAFDYERAWYNGMRLHSDDEYYIPDEDLEAVKNDIKYAFRGTDNFRFGLEVKCSDEFYIRGGYALSLSPLADGIDPTSRSRYSTLDNPVITRSESWSCGVGYRKGGFSLDAAYVGSEYRFANSLPFWYDNPELTSTPGSGVFSRTMERGMATLTAGFRF